MPSPRVRRISPLVALLVVACGGKSPPSSATGTPTSNGATTTNGAAGLTAGSSTSTPEGASSAGASAGAAEATGPAPEPIDAKLPDDVDKTPPFARGAECGPSCNTLKTLVPPSLVAQVDPAWPVFLWEEVIPRKGAFILPRHSGVDVYAILIDGEVSILADDIPGKQKRLWKWNAAHVPGAGVTIFAKEPTRMLIAIAATASTGTIRQAIDALAKPQSVAWTKRPSPVASIEIDKQPDLAWGGGAYHVRLGFEGGAEPESASLETLLTSKSAPVKEHVHDKEWELLAVVKGDGKLVRKPGGKDDSVSVGPGTLAAIPPGTPHAYEPSGSSPMVAVQMYWPPGPEQRFKKLAADGKK